MPCRCLSSFDPRVIRYMCARFANRFGDLRVLSKGKHCCALKSLCDRFSHVESSTVQVPRGGVLAGTGLDARIMVPFVWNLS